MIELRRGSIAALSAAAGAAALVAAPARPSGSVTVDSFGFWSLTRLGATAPITIDAGPASPSPSVPFAFPANARQGPATWYLGRLRATVRLAGCSGAVVYLNGSVGGADWAQVRISCHRKAGVETTAWASAGAIDGGARGSAVGRVAHVAFQNYLQQASVRPGASDLSFRLERYQGAVVTSAVVGALSGLEYSTVAPARLNVSVLGRATARRGTSFPLTVRVANSGGRPARGIRIVWELPGDRVRLVSGPRHLPVVRGHSAELLHYRLLAIRPGVATLVVATLAAGGGDTMTYPMRVTR